MQYQSVSEIYDANDNIRGKLSELLASLSDHQTSALPEGEKWTIAKIAEHVALVSGGIQRICANLLSKAEAAGSVSDGTIDLSTLTSGYSGAAELKLEAPEMVQPTGGRSIAESLKALDNAGTAFDQIKPSFEKYDGNPHKFPHPYFGDLSALEWLVLSGGHEARHMRQILKMLEKIG